MRKTSLSLSEAVKAAAEGPLPQQAQALYDLTYIRTVALNDSARRSALWLAAIVGASILINTSSISGFQLGPVAISSVDPLAKILPVLGFFFIYDIAILSAKLVQCTYLLRRLNEKYRPRLHAGPFRSVAYPASGSIYGFFPQWLLNSNPLGRVAAHLQWLFIVLRTITPIATLLGWFWLLFARYGITDLLVWVSLIASTSLLALSLLVLWLAYSDGAVSTTFDVRG